MGRRRGTSGKYRNLSQVRRPALKPNNPDDLGILAEEFGPHWRFREEFSILDYCTYHVLIAFIVLIVVVTTVSLAIVLSPKQELIRTHPNILVVIADDLGYNDVGYQGHGDIKTPYIDRLASSSIMLQRHYTQPMCSPSRAALFTGRYPFRYGMGGSRAIYYGSKNGLDLSEYLLPQALKTADYKTYLIGKWHLGFADWAMTPTRRGFDYFYGTYGGSTTYQSHQSYEGPRSGKGYDLFEDIASDQGNTKVNHTIINDPNETFSELLFTEKAVQIIEEAFPVNDKDQEDGADKNENEDKPKPIFMVMSYQNPHAPITPMEEDVAQNEDIENENRRKMAAMITSLDYGVGRITSALEKTHQFNNTIIIFLSDNGGHLMMPSGESLGSSNLPFRGAKCTLYEGGVRTPAFIKIPHLITSGQVNSSVKYDGLFHISDWFPTIVSLAQLDPRLLKKELQFQDDKNPYLDGIDHSETFKQLLDETQRAEAPRDHVVLDIDPVFNQAAIIKGKYKLIVGKAAFMDFDQVYPLIDDNSIKNEDIVVNASYYKISPNISQQMRAYAETQTTYAADPLKCRHLDCMTKDKLLFDLSWDVTESNDLSWRFSAETDELYETLRTYSNRTHVPVEPKFFEDQNEEAKIDDVWTPWLLNSTEV